MRTNIIFSIILGMLFLSGCKKYEVVYGTDYTHLPLAKERSILYVYDDDLYITDPLFKHIRCINENKPLGFVKLLTFSPKHDKIAYVSGINRIVIVDTLFNQLDLIIQPGGVTDMQWASDNKTLVVLDYNSELFQYFDTISLPNPLVSFPPNSIFRKISNFAIDNEGNIACMYQYKTTPNNFYYTYLLLHKKDGTTVVAGQVNANEFSYDCKRMRCINGKFYITKKHNRFQYSLVEIFINGGIGQRSILSDITGSFNPISATEYAFIAPDSQDKFIIYKNGEGIKYYFSKASDIFVEFPMESSSNQFDLVWQ